MPLGYATAQFDVFAGVCVNSYAVCDKMGHYFVSVIKSDLSAFKLFKYVVRLIQIECNDCL